MVSVRETCSRRWRGHANNCSILNVALLLRHGVLIFVHEDVIEPFVQESDERLVANRLQSSILHRMRSLNHNLTVVGDDAQSCSAYPEQGTRSREEPRRTQEDRRFHRLDGLDRLSAASSQAAFLHQQLAARKTRRQRTYSGCGGVEFAFDYRLVRRNRLGARTVFFGNELF
jgi:hypothetical protein